MVHSSVLSVIETVLCKNRVVYDIQKGNGVKIFFCKQKGVRFNIKVSSDGNVRIWAYSIKQVCAEEKAFVESVMGAFSLRPPQMRCYVNKDGLVILERSFSCSEPSEIEEKVNHFCDSVLKNIPFISIVDVDETVVTYLDFYTLIFCRLFFDPNA